jgi:hypothetical protein
MPRHLTDLTLDFHLPIATRSRAAWKLEVSCLYLLNRQADIWILSPIMEDDILGQLDAVVFKELGIAQETIDHVSGARPKAFDHKQIYNEQYEDDDEELGEMEQDDLEAQVDREMDRERQRNYERGLRGLNGAGTARSVDEDFDEEDYDEGVKAEDNDDYLFEGMDDSDEEEVEEEQERRIDLSQIYPSFAPGKVLDFTELFSRRPKKRPRLEKPPLKRE